MSIMSHPQKAPPAFQEYASDILSNKNFKLMSLDERGLFYTLKCECWVNRKLPSNPEELAKYMGIPPADIRAALTPRVLGFFAEEVNEMYSPDLEGYRELLDTRRQRQSCGGVKGGKTTQANHKKNQVIAAAKRKGTAQSGLEGDLEGNLQGGVKALSGEVSRREEKYKNESLTGEHHEWVNELTEHEPGFNNGVYPRSGHRGRATQIFTS